MSRWMDRWMNEWVDGWMNEWNNEQMDGWMSGWMNGWMDTWVDGWKAGNDMLTNNKAEMWGKEACTRKTVNVNILQTQFHSCFCVQAKHNSSWPSFTTTGRLRDCFLFALFFWTGDQSVRFLQCFLFTATVQRAADRPEETACTLRRGTCCSTSALSLSISWHLEYILNGQGERGCG